MTKFRSAHNKRGRERARQEKQQQKAAKRQDGKLRKAQRPVIPGEDPDIAGIVPGPQPSPWGDAEDAEEAAETEETEE